VVAYVPICAGNRNGEVKPIRDVIEIVIRNDESRTNSTLLSSNLGIEIDVPDLTGPGFARIQRGSLPPPRR